jgi:uncharacterized protein (TIGR03435 family)
VIVLLGNHLWQSTLFAAIAATMTHAFRHDRAHVRYWLWLTSSLKFLVPFGALVAMGGQLRWPASAPIVQPAVTFVIDSVAGPFAPPDSSAVTAGAGLSQNSATSAVAIVLLSIWLVGFAGILFARWIRWRRISTAIRQARRVGDGRAFDALNCMQRISGLARPIAMVTSETLLEPGVFGIWHPVLLWPTHLSERLSDSQIEAILAHELAHVVRRDNLTAALHMAVEAIFWFHPVVWWIGARLVDERERACDEAVVQLGSDPAVYAESILKTCEFCVESLLACVAGVTGSDLKKRIERIMKNEARTSLNPLKEMLLAVAGLVAIAAPVTAGALITSDRHPQTPSTHVLVPSAIVISALATHAPGNMPSQAIGRSTASHQPQSPKTGAGQAFVTVSIKSNTSGEPAPGEWTMAEGRVAVKNVTLRQLILNAYQVQGARISGGPAWLNTDGFDIDARAGANATSDQLRAMLRKLLSDRFKLTVHTDSRNVPIYTLVLARSDGTLGPQIRPSDCAGKDAPPQPGLDPGQGPSLYCGGSQSRQGRLAARWMTMAQFAQNALSPIVGRVVLDQTGLTGKYDLEAHWTPDSRPPGPQAAGVGPATLAALEEQLGLKVNSELSTVDILVIDHADHPVRE